MKRVVAPPTPETKAKNDIAQALANAEKANSVVALRVEVARLARALDSVLDLLNR